MMCILMAEKDRTQDELFVLFNFLAESGRQMIFTSALPIAELGGVEARLRSRLEGGLVVELPAPEREIRQQVIERLMVAKLGSLDPELAEYLASRPADSIRAVSGLLQRVLNAAETKGRGAGCRARPRSARGRRPQASPPPGRAFQRHCGPGGRRPEPGKGGLGLA